MTIKTSIFLTDDQEAYARSLIDAGQYPGLGAVIQRGLEMLRHENDPREAEIAALRSLIGQRREGPFIDIDVGRRKQGPFWNANRGPVRVYKVRRAAGMTHDFEPIEDCLVRVYQDLGDHSAGAMERTGSRIGGALLYLRTFERHPHRGTEHADIGSGVRTVAHERLFVSFEMDHPCARSGFSLSFPVVRTVASRSSNAFTDRGKGANKAPPAPVLPRLTEAPAEQTANGATNQPTAGADGRPAR